MNNSYFLHKKAMYEKTYIAFYKESNDNCKLFCFEDI